MLCFECECYLLSSGKPVPKEYWPAMVWAYLCHNSSNSSSLLQTSLCHRWALIPLPWWNWWLSQVCTLGDDSITLHNPPSLFQDKSTEAKDFDEAIMNLRWMDLAQEMDKHLAYPEVRCPWGCSEFLHRCNKLPLEEFLYHHSNWTFDCYGASTAMPRRWTDCIRPDFPSSVILLENVNFLCAPTICITDQGAQILACRNHTSRSRERYIYPPVTMTGTLFTESSNQFSPAVCRSRTLRQTKLHYFSDTYQTGILQGGYDGIDSSYVTNKGNLRHSNSLALLRDSLSIQGRTDICEYVCRLGQNPFDLAYVPENIVERKLAVAQTMFSDLPEREELKASTYVSLIDAIELQEQSYDAKSQGIIVHNSSGESTEVLFDPPWPRRQLRVHPYDGFGERFLRIKDPTKSCAGFILLGLMTVVDEFWSILASNVKSDQDWFGWWLVLATESLKLPGRKRGNQSKKLFHVERPPQRALERLGLPDGNFSIHHFTDLFQRLPGVKVTQGDWRGHEDATTNVFIVLEPTDIILEHRTWELWCLIFKTACAQCHGQNARNAESSNQISIYARHSKQAWWCQPSQSSDFSRSAGLPNSLDGLQLAVYCRQIGDRQEELRRRYLKCLGGQNICYCGVHMVALVTNAHPQLTDGSIGCVILEPFAEGGRGMPSTCSNRTAYVCPEKGCSIGICENHWANISKEQYHPSQVFFISQDDCILGTEEEIIQNSDVIFGSGSYTGLDRTLLGPTEAHELPTDLFEMHDEDRENLVESSNEEEDEDEDEDDRGIIRTTNAARQAMGIDLHGPADVVSSPFHVLLNMQGHLLIRKLKFL